MPWILYEFVKKKDKQWWHIALDAILQTCSCLVVPQGLWAPLYSLCVRFSHWHMNCSPKSCKKFPEMSFITILCARSVNLFVVVFVLFLRITGILPFYQHYKTVDNSCAPVWCFCMSCSAPKAMLIKITYVGN